MRDPQIVLKQLSSFKEDQRVTNLYKYLYNPEFYKIAYQNIGFKPSQMTPSSDGSTIDGMSMERINKLIKKLHDNTYQPTPVRRVNIPKKSGGTRPISVPSFEDKLVQEIIRMILEALYDHTFSEHSHGFRPGKSCHTALKFTQLKFQGTKWWIDADIKGCFDNINHVILLDILKEKIREQKFIHLINLFLKAGYIENWQYHKTYSGTPQGSIISPILTNIYLNKFDKYMEEMISEFTCGKHRKVDKTYHYLQTRVTNAKSSLKKNKSTDVDRYKTRKKELQKYVNENGCYDYQDPEFQRLYYVRYADDFLIGVISSKEKTEEIRNKVQTFLKEKLKLELNGEKSKISHNSERIRFLGYEMTVTSSKEKRSLSGNIFLWLPHEVMTSFIITNRFGKFVQDKKTGKPKLKATHRSEMIAIEEIEILHQYNSKIRGIYNYYKLASNVCKINNFKYVCQTSFLKTLSAKYRLTCSKLYRNKNYNQNNKVGITNKGKFIELFSGPFTVQKYVEFDKNIDIIQSISKYFLKTSLQDRLDAKECELCGNTDGPFEIHHIHKLKDLKGKTKWEQLMISRNRKSLVLCISCHHKLHNNQL